MSQSHPSSARGRRYFAWLFAGALVVLVAVGAYFAVQRREIPRIDPTDTAQVEMGRRVYAQECASCHGASLEGQPSWQRRLPNGRLPAPPHDASGHTWHHPDEMLFRITKYGPGAYPSGYQTDMPAFEKRLTDAKIAASLSFIKSTWPAEVRIKQARIDATRREQR
jgi:mono/diheme cytochrome c family protein